MKTEIAMEAGGNKSAEIKKSLKEDTRSNKKVSIDADSKKPSRNPKIKDIGKENATDNRSLSEDKSGDEQSESTKKGRLKNLAGFWSTPQDDAKVYRKKRLQIDETSPAESVSSEPAPLLLSRRAEESNLERPKPEIDQGYAKNMASIFQNRPKSASETKKQFRLDIEEENNEENSKTGESKVEGEAGDQIQPSSVKLKRRIKDLAGTFQSNSKDDDPAVQPSADQKPIDPILESCRKKGLAERWNQQKLAQKSMDDESADEASAGEEAKKSKQAWWLQELEEARQQESQGVFENEPEVRDDVIRADDEMPDVISARSTRKTRQLWSTIEQEKKKEKEEEEKKAEEKKAEKAKARKISDTNTPDSSKSIKIEEEGKGKSSKDKEEPQESINKSAKAGKDSKCENVEGKSGERSSDNKADDSTLVKTRKSKSADNEDEEWFDASGFLLNNASLLHVPRGKPLRGYVE